MNLRQRQDKRGNGLVQCVLALADEHRPWHLPLAGGDPHPPASTEMCIFAQTTQTVSADLKSKYNLGLGVTAGGIYRASKLCE